jgi:predicted transcriptional regulator
MQMQRTVDRALRPRPPEPASSAVPQRSARRATARRASTRRATARQRKNDVERHIIEYLKDRPQSTTGDIAKGLNADRGTIAAGLLHIARAAGVSKGEAGR